MDAYFPFDAYENYAIPVLKPLCNRTYCSRLMGLFKLSKPTYYDLEVLKNNQTIDCGGFECDSPEERKEENLRISHFGRLENFLENYTVENVCKF